MKNRHLYALEKTKQKQKQGEQISCFDVFYDSTEKTPQQTVTDGEKNIILSTIKFSSAEKGTGASGVSIFELLGRKKNHSIASKDDLVTSNYIFHGIISVKKLFLSLVN